MGVQWADISSWQPIVNNTYPYEILCIRSNDGTYVDPHFMANYSWAITALNANRLRALIVYFVYRQNWQETVQTHLNLLGTLRNDIVSMIDVESWNGQITGDQSQSLNNSTAVLTGYYGGHSERIIVYGNRYDLQDLWPHHSDSLQYVIADYSSIQPTHPGIIGWQYSSTVATPPFGSCDSNRSVNSQTVEDFCREIGIDHDIPEEVMTNIPLTYFSETFQPDPAGLNFRGSIAAEAGNNSVVISEAFVRWGVKWGNATFKIVAWGATAPIGEPNYSFDFWEIPPGTRSITVEGRRDGAATIPNALLINKPV